MSLSIAATRPRRARSVVAADLDRVLQPDVERASQEQERPFEPRCGAFNRWDASPGSDLSVSAANSLSIAACSASKRASSVSAISSPTRCSGRTHAICAMSAGATPAAIGLLRQIEEAIEQAHHRRLPRGRAHAVVLRERGLAQERVVDEPRAEQRELLAHRQARPCR